MISSKQTITGKRQAEDVPAMAPPLRTLAPMPRRRQLPPLAGRPGVHVPAMAQLEGQRSEKRRKTESVGSSSSSPSPKGKHAKKPVGMLTEMYKLAKEEADRAGVIIATHQQAHHYYDVSQRRQRQANMVEAGEEQMGLPQQQQQFVGGLQGQFWNLSWGYPTAGSMPNQFPYQGNPQHPGYLQAPVTGFNAPMPFPAQGYWPNAGFQQEMPYTAEFVQDPLSQWDVPAPAPEDAPAFDFNGVFDPAQPTGDFFALAPEVAQDTPVAEDPLVVLYESAIVAPEVAGDLPEYPWLIDAAAEEAIRAASAAAAAATAASAVEPTAVPVPEDDEILQAVIGVGSPVLRAQEQVDEAWQTFDFEAWEAEISRS